MKALLLYPDRDVDLSQPLPPNAEALMQDLELKTLLEAMSAGDAFLFDVAKVILLTAAANDAQVIGYRQEALKDGLRHPDILRSMYAMAVDAIEREKKNYWGIFRDYPDAILRRSIEVLQMFVEVLRQLRRIADTQADGFASPAFGNFFRMLQRELSDDYFACIQQHLKELRFGRGVLVSARLGRGNKGENYTLRRMPEKKRSLVEQVFGRKPPVYGFTIADRDESGARALSELRDRGLNPIANALAQSTDHILSFFQMLRAELAFYVGCLNLYDRLQNIGEPTCFPVTAPPDEERLSFRQLYDVCLALSGGQRVVGNDASLDGKRLVIITGANQGGKTIFLRSIGLAQLMLQSGMFAPAESLHASLCSGVFTHYKREEDADMKSGKLDEELTRMSAIVDWLTPHAMLFFNESFAATNEREGSEIARQITAALIEKRQRVFFVTHLYKFAHDFYLQRLPEAAFLRAERQADGERTFRLTEGEPLQTSYGEDLYAQVFNGKLAE